MANNQSHWEWTLSFFNWSPMNTSCNTPWWSFLCCLQTQRYRTSTCQQRHCQKMGRAIHYRSLFMYIMKQNGTSAEVLRTKAPTVRCLIELRHQHHLIHFLLGASSLDATKQINYGSQDNILTVKHLSALKIRTGEAAK